MNLTFFTRDEMVLYVLIIFEVIDMGGIIFDLKPFVEKPERTKGSKYKAII